MMATVTVTSRLGNAVALHVDKMVDDSMHGAPCPNATGVATAHRGEVVEIQPGPNPGIDKAWWMAWHAQNKGTALWEHLGAEDEKETDDAAQEA